MSGKSSQREGEGETVAGGGELAPPFRVRVVVVGVGRWFLWLAGGWVFFYGFIKTYLASKYNYSWFKSTPYCIILFMVMFVYFFSSYEVHI